MSCDFYLFTVEFLVEVGDREIALTRQPVTEDTEEGTEDHRGDHIGGIVEVQVQPGKASVSGVNRLITKIRRNSKPWHLALPNKQP